jgi:heme oxygenase
MLLSDRHRLLRSRTEAIHKQLDDTIGHFTDKASYARYLRGMLEFRAGVENDLAGNVLPGEFDDFQPSRIADELRSDLAVTGTPALDPGEVATEAVPGPAPSRDALYGMLYVLEGSALGSRVLVRRCAAFGVGETTGAAHLVKQSASLRNWQAFCALLAGAKKIDEDAMVDAAVATFSRALSAYEKV